MGIFSYLGGGGAASTPYAEFCRWLLGQILNINNWSKSAIETKIHCHKPNDLTKNPVKKIKFIFSQPV